jgi:hypothetical protein
VPGRHTDTATDAYAEADRRADADAGTHRRAHAERDVSGAHVVALAHTPPDGVTDTIAGTRVTEPGTRDARIDRFGGDDRRLGVDLAALPELTRCAWIAAVTTDQALRSRCGAARSGAACG